MESSNESYSKEKNLENISNYHKIWSYIHSDEFLSQSFDSQLKELERIILEDLSFCACGQDAHFIITCMLKYIKIKQYNLDTYEKCKFFWSAFHNIVRSKLNQDIIVPSIALHKP